MERSIRWIGTRCRRWLAALAVLLAVTVWVLNASRVGSGVEGCPEGCATAGQQQSGSLRVMSLNVLHGFPRFQHLSERLERIAEEIRAQEADIVCLQEVPWTPHLGNGARYLAERTGLNYQYLRANGNRWAILFEEGEAILSRYPLRDATFIELEPRAGFFEHRVVLEATAVTPWGNVRFFVTHLTNGAPEVNRAQTASLMAFVAAPGGEPAIVAGDFNATEDTVQIQALTRRWVDTYRAVHPNDNDNDNNEGHTCCADEPSAGPAETLEKRIDYVFLVPGMAHSAEVVSSQRVLDRPFRTPDGWLWASDHAGLLTVIQLER